MASYEYRWVDCGGLDQWVAGLDDHTEVQSWSGSKAKARDLIISVISAPLVGAVFLAVIIAGGITVLKNFTGGRKAIL